MSLARVDQLRHRAADHRKSTVLVFALQMPPDLDCPFEFSELRLRTV
jgi:hypothetical protein